MYFSGTELILDLNTNGGPFKITDYYRESGSWSNRDLFTVHQHLGVTLAAGDLTLTEPGAGLVLGNKDVNNWFATEAGQINFWVDQQYWGSGGLVDDTSTVIPLAFDVWRSTDSSNWTGKMNRWHFRWFIEGGSDTSMLAYDPLDGDLTVKDIILDSGVHHDTSLNSNLYFKKNGITHGNFYTGTNLGFGVWNDIKWASSEIGSYTNRYNTGENQFYPSGQFPRPWPFPANPTPGQTHSATGVIGGTHTWTWTQLESISSPPPVTSIALTSGNDTSKYPGRWPSEFYFYGSNDGGTTWEIIHSQGLSATTANSTRFVYSTQNNQSNGYLRYKILFTRRSGGDGTNLDEIELLDASGNDVTSPGDPVVKSPNNSTVNTLGSEARAFDNTGSKLELYGSHGLGGVEVTPSWTPAAFDAEAAGVFEQAELIYNNNDYGYWKHTGGVESFNNPDGIEFYWDDYLATWITTGDPGYSEVTKVNTFSFINQTGNIMSTIKGAQDMAVQRSGAVSQMVCTDARNFACFSVKDNLYNPRSAISNITNPFGSGYQEILDNNVNSVGVFGTDGQGTPTHLNLGWGNSYGLGIEPGSLTLSAHQWFLFYGKKSIEVTGDKFDDSTQSLPAEDQSWSNTENDSVRRRPLVAALMCQDLNFDNYTGPSDPDNSNLAGPIADAGSIGTFMLAGDLIAFYDFSDERLKENVLELNSDESLNKILNLQAVKFNWTKEAMGINKSRVGKTEIGFIAQQVEPIVPEVVRRQGRINEAPGDTYLHVDYDKIVPLLVESIKEQQKQIDELKQQIEQLKQQ